MKKLLARFGLPGILFTACIGLWLLTSLFAEDWQASVGPDFLTRLPTKLAVLAVILASLRLVIKFAFPSVYSFTNTDGGQKESEFAKAWSETPHDPRLWISVITYLIALLALSQAFLSS
jgi:hypothetical protein